MTITMQEKKIDLGEVSEKMGKELVTKFIHAFTTKIDDEEKSAILYYIVQNATDFQNMTVDQQMLIHLNLFTSVLHKTPKGSCKNSFIDNTIKILGNLKSINAATKTKH